MTKLVTVVDYGMGNLRSVSKAAEHVAGCNTKIIISSNPEDIRSADAVIFPGQGAAKSCMQALNNTGMIHALQDAIVEKPFLGICMGLQVLMESSSENQGVECLGFIKGKVSKLDLSQHANLKLPHMGWNEIKQNNDHPMWHKIPQNTRFYFVHSYVVKPEDNNIICGTSTHGQKFTSAIANKNLFAIQAHPEKSADAGLQLFKNFLTWDGK
jgi:glutamine amidotransferase